MNEFAEIRAIRSARKRMAWFLTFWAIGSIAAGFGAYWVSGQQDSASRKFGEALAAQFVIWGAIDLVFGLMGVVYSRSTGGTPLGTSSAQRERADCDKLIKTLQFNTRLNWLWLAAGVVLLVAGLGAWLRGSTAEAVGSLLGHAAGVLLQGGFLFWFDRRFVAQLQSIRTSVVAA